MKVISYGTQHEIYPDDLKTGDALLPATYKVNFHPMKGFWLDEIIDFENKEEKVYGNHEEKIDKVFNSYERFDRSMGVILSGDKGIGKSLFVQLLSEQAIAKGMPVVIVSKPFKGVAEFIDSIHQECLVMFDEFEKVFSINSDDNESQNDLLGLFDGTSQAKRLYAITVNKLHLVSEFMVSRTGRFHYHIRFDYPTPAEIQIYLKDKLEEAYYTEIPNVIAFAHKVKLNYDSLRAIAFELNAGYSFGAAIGDLNILNTDLQRYDINVYFTNGETSMLGSNTLDLFSEELEVGGHTPKESNYFEITFDPTDIQYNEDDQMVVNGAKIRFNQYGEDEHKEDLQVSGIVIALKPEKSVNYKYAV